MINHILIGCYIVIGVIYLGVISYFIKMHTDHGRFWVQGFKNAAHLTEAECTACNGYGNLWLRPYQGGTKLAKIPEEYGGDAEHLPQIGDLSECEECGGSGFRVKETGREQFEYIPLDLPWRRDF
jgi:hypothetical protein